MLKNFHEIRDPIHVFIKLDTDERKILDSYPFQRLRYIHQLAMSYLVYPGATHKRFEHSLGVMELAGKIFDVITNKDNIHDKIRELLPQIGIEDQLRYWRRALRMAALCHDLGHLPFSHAAEKELLPEGWDHERLTIAFINSPEMRSIWDQVTPPLRPEDIVKLAVGPKKLKGVIFNDWEAIMSEIIVGNSFGVDRIDYLLRDSYHAGVAYGKFDHFRLIDTLRILPRSSGEHEENIRRDVYPSKNSTVEFPVLCSDGRIAASFDKSQTLQSLPEASFDYIFIRPDLRKQAQEWLRDNRDDDLLSRRIEEGVNLKAFKVTGIPQRRRV